jgi:hypothetical protein
MFMVEALEPRQLLSGLTVTAAGRAAGFSLTTFATGFPVVSNIGPLGMVFPASGGVLVSDSSGNVRRFLSDTDGQNAATVPPVSGASSGAGTTSGLARVGANLYLMMSGLNHIAQINDDGTLRNVMAKGTAPLGVAVNPVNGHLFVSSFNSKIYDVNPVTGSASVFLNVSADGLAFDPTSGILYAAARGNTRVEGFNVTTKALVYDSGTIPGGPDGIALGTGPVAGNLFVNTNGGTVVEVKLATAAQTVIASGGSRGDFVTVDQNNGTLLLTQSDRIMRLIPGVFVIPPHLLTTTTTLDVTPQTSTFGQTVTLTAAVATAATGIPTGTVTFAIDGQAQAPVALTEVGGLDQASLTTSTLLQGNRTVTATYNGDPTFASSGSNPATVTINALPQIVGAQVVRTPQRNKKGKPLGKSVLVGFALDYSTAMNPATSGLPANYQVTFAATQRVKRKQIPVDESVVVQPTYNASTDVVTLTIVGKKPSFAKGGQINIIATPPNGVSSATGVFLAADDTVFIILPKATAVWRSGRIESAKISKSVPGSNR